MTEPAGGGLLDSLRRMLATLLALAATRLELVTTELEEEMHRLARLLLWSVGSLLAASLALLLAAVTIIIACWDTCRLAAAGGLTAVFTVAALVGWWVVRRQLRERPPLLAATRQELAHDQDALGGSVGLRRDGAPTSGPNGGPGEGL
jgi:uncharacterized membrane protein YqjE